MARKPNIAGNWKMNKTAAEAVTLVDELKNAVADVAGCDIVVCPPFTSLKAVADRIAGSPVALGAQSIHWEESGAFTGEISAAMLREIPVQYVIIGHSERRQYFGETNETVNARLKTALSAGFTPIVCVGETLEQREANETERVVGEQLGKGFADITPAQMVKTIVAYEPVWAIGTGRTATPDQAQDVHHFIRNCLRERFGTDVADSVVIQYGGSVKPKNAADLLAQPDIDGALVGGASLKAQDFAKIVRAAV